MKNSEQMRDMTTGVPLGHIIRFMIPLAAANLMQQLYTMVDAVIVGQGVGVEALAAIGATDWSNAFMLWLLKGIADGFAVLIAIYFGEKNQDKLSQSIHMTLLLGGAAGILMTIVGMLAVKPLMRLLNTPEAIIETAQLYLTIIYGGTFFVTLYCISSSILRAVGDSKSPFQAIVLSAGTNICLDLIAVFGLGLGLPGAAGATVISQAMGAVFCFSKVRKLGIVRWKGDAWKPDVQLMGKLMKLGIPMALQMSFIAVGGMILQSMINRYGVVLVAGFAATNKLNLLVEGFAMALGGAMATYTGQNLGAGRKKRIKQGLRCGLLIAVSISLVLGAVMILSGKKILMLFISSDPQTEAQVLRVAYHFLFILCLFLPLLYILYVYRQSIMGLGNTLIPMASGISEFVFRVIPALVLTQTVGAEALYYAEILAWTGADLVLVGPYYVIFSHINFKEE